MEPPAKRQKVGRNLAEADEDDDDELTCAPDELNQRRDPAFQLHKGRALAANKLKFKFEEIIAKYSRDFTGIGDEIDLVTGEVVVDNGHVRSMRSQKDTGDGEDADENSDEEEARILRGVRAANRAPGPDPASSTMRRDPWEVAGPSWPTKPAMGAPRLTSMLSSQPSFMSPPQSFSPFGYRDPMTMSVDPVWQAPDLPESAFSNRFGVNGQQFALGMTAPSRTMVRKALPPPVSPDSDDDDVLLGVSENVVRKAAEKESPLIRKKFPTIDSPNEDPVFNDFINDLIENPPSTPPSIKRPNLQRPRGRPSKLKETQTADTGVVPEERPRAGGERDAEADSGAGDIDRGQADPSWEEEDLMNFHDVTGRSVQPTGQALFVDIRTTKNRSSEPSATEDHAKKLQIANTQSSTRNGESVTIETDAKKPPPATKKRRPQEKFKRNTIDPAFCFSDEENMLPKKERRVRRRSEPAKIAAVQDAQEAADPPDSQDTFERNPMDASYGFSDDERLLPRRPNRGKRKSELAVVAEDVSEETRSNEKVKTLTKSKAEMETAEATQRTNQPVLKSKTINQEQAARSAKGNERLPESETPKSGQAMGATGPQSRRRKSQGRVASQIASAGSQTAKTKAAQAAPGAQSPQLAAPLIPKHSGAEPAIEKHTPKSERPNPTHGEEAAGSGSANPRPRSASSAQKSCGPGDTSLPDAADPAAPEPAQSAPPAPRSTGSPAATAAAAAAAATAQQQPSTPQRPSKGHFRATPPSALDLISLLSDSDDDEDEISFDLADFTPSGHHRILVHRAFPRLAASAPASSYSHSHSTSTTKNDRNHNNNSSSNSSIRKNKNKKKRASLFGPYASASARKLATTTTTPGSAGRVPSTSKKNERKNKRARDSLGLPRSVVRAHRRGGDDTNHNSRAPSPTGSVVQTPGGTKRRCGADGFQCDRDFCFVCL